MANEKKAEEKGTKNSVVGSAATANGKGKLPYALKSVKDGVAVIVFDGKEHTVKLNDGMLKYILDAGFRTRISAAGAGADKGLPEQQKALDNLVKGTFGRVGVDVGDIEAAIDAMESLAGITDVTALIQNAPKGKQVALFEALNERIVELATPEVAGK